MDLVLFYHIRNFNFFILFEQRVVLNEKLKSINFLFSNSRLIWKLYIIEWIFWNGSGITDDHKANSIDFKKKIRYIIDFNFWLSWLII